MEGEGVTGLPGLAEIGGWAYLNAALRTRAAFPLENIEREAAKAGVQATIRPIAGPEDSELDWAIVTELRAGAGIDAGVREEKAMGRDLVGKPLTERQQQIMDLLRTADGPLTANQIALRLGFDYAPSKGGIGGGRGSGAGTGPAQRVLGSLNGLKRRGLIFPLGDGYMA